LTEKHEPTLFDWAGGLPALTHMTRIFYEKYVSQDELLAPLFAGMASDHPERVAIWLGEVFGGPKTYTEHHGGYPHMVSQHLGKGLTEAQRAQWARLICLAADEAGLPTDPEFRSAFVSYIEWGSRIALENSAPGAHPTLHLPVPRWDWGTAGPPGIRVSALAGEPVEQERITLPTADDPLHFSEHIQPLFRPKDRQSMKWAFDLWSYEDVTTHASGILQRLQSGSMPCDGAWPQEKLDLFQRWITSGMPK
jgi:truncated hemoglobin YjbI